MAEEITQEQKEEFLKKRREIALFQLDSSLWSYALPKFADASQYGQLYKNAEAKYDEVMENSPEKVVWDAVFKEALNKGLGVSNAYIQETSARIIQENLLSLKTEDIANYFGSKGTFKEDYEDKYIAELSQEEAQFIAGGYVKYKTDEMVQQLWGDSRKNIKTGIEKLLFKEEKSLEEAA